MSLGDRVSEFRERDTRRFAVLVLVLILLPLLIGFSFWFLWAVSEFFEETPSFDYFFWLGLIVGGGTLVFVVAAIRDLWNKQIRTKHTSPEVP